MIGNKKVLAVTPARGGSKGLPGKNIRQLCGIPLIGHAIVCAKNSRFIDEIVVSTDCPDISSIAKEFGAKIHARPERLATDTALVIDTLVHLFDSLKTDYDYCVLLEATAPMRTVSLVDQCIELLDKKKCDSVATFSEAEPAPSRLWKIAAGAATKYFDDSDPWMPRQSQEVGYHLNGLVYVFDIHKLRDSSSRSVFFGNSYAVITKEKNIDIDTIDDFNYAEFLMGKLNETL